MTTPENPPVGRRIRSLRIRSGKTQAVLAGLSGVTEDYLSRIERGLKTPSSQVQQRLAESLGVPVSALVTGTPPPALRPPGKTPKEVPKALTQRPLATGTPVAAVLLRERVDSAWQIWQTGEKRFTQIEAVLPDLIHDVEHAVQCRDRSNHRHERRETLRAAADLYGLLRSYCRRIGRHDQALMVADRAIRAAQDADDPLRIAAGQWNLGHVLLSDPRPDAAAEARDLAAEAAEQLRREPLGEAGRAMQGALALGHAAAAAADQKWWDARRQLERVAKPLAKQVGEGNVQWTVFGPTNVSLHAVSVEMLAGEATTGLQQADEIDTSALPSMERQFAFDLQVARCHDLLREDPAVFVHLLQLEELSPEDLQRSALACDMVVDLLGRVRPTYRHQVARLAERLQLV